MYNLEEYINQNNEINTLHRIIQHDKRQAYFCAHKFHLLKYNDIHAVCNVLIQFGFRIYSLLYVKILFAIELYLKANIKKYRKRVAYFVPL